MNSSITHLNQIVSPARKRNARGFHVDGMPAAFRCVLLAIAVISGLSVTHAQTPDPLTITSAGNVGIGTTAPANKLSVAGNADFSGDVGVGTTSSTRTLTVGGSFAQNAIAGWRDAYKLFRDGAQKASIGTDSTGAKLQFFTGPETKDETARLTIDSSGKVGIGTTSPDQLLDIFSSNSSFGMLRVNQNSATQGEASIGFFDTNARTNNTAWVVGVGGWGKTGKFVIGNENAGAGGNVRFVIERTGAIGIGTDAPTKGRVEINGSVNGNLASMSGYFGAFPQKIGVHNPTVSDGDVTLPVVFAGNVQNEPVSLYASHEIWAKAFRAFSDERIKRIGGRSSGWRDLDTLLSIEVTDYSYIDSVSQGTGMQKKIIGQQVEKVFPQAVTRSTNVLPDIYQKATTKDGWVTLATTLKKGERVRLIGEKQEGIHEVLEIADGKFRTDFVPEGDQVFVYGREVNDARSVDYDAISMLNVSATQQIKKEKDEEVKALQEENAALRSQLAEQEKRLAAIEALLLSGEKPAARTASLKKRD